MLLPAGFDKGREIGKHVKYKVTIWEDEDRLTIEYIKTDNEDVDLDWLIKELAYQFAGFHQSFIHMQGEVETYRLPRYE